MKSLIVVAGSLLLSSMVFAGSVTLSPGESMTISPNQTTTVTCSGSSGAPPRVIEFAYCDCYTANFNGVRMSKASIHIKYSDSASPTVQLLKEFRDRGYSSDIERECQEFIKSVSQCRQ